MIEIRNVTKQIGDDKIIVDDISLTAKGGEIVGFIGPNGAGKTTTIKMLVGILKPTEGSVLINGVDIEKDGLKAKAEIGYVSDSPDMFLRLKGYEYLNFIADIYGVDEETRKENIEKYSALMGIDKNLGESIANYSHGMRQKIMIVSALVHNPSVLVLDEPLIGLDPTSTYNLKEIMKDYAKAGNTVFFSTHMLETAEKLCSKVIIINRGKIMYDGLLEDLKQQYVHDESLEKIYLEMVEHND